MPGLDANRLYVFRRMVGCMTGRALVFARHQVVQSLSTSQRMRSYCAGKTEIGVVVAPNIGKGIPAMALSNQQPCFNQFILSKVDRVRISVPLRHGEQFALVILWVQERFADDAAYRQCKGF